MKYSVIAQDKETKKYAILAYMDFETPSGHIRPRLMFSTPYMFKSYEHASVEVLKDYPLFKDVPLVCCNGQ